MDLSNSAFSMCRYASVIFTLEWFINFETCSILIPLFRTFVANVWRLIWNVICQSYLIFLDIRTSPLLT